MNVMPGLYQPASCGIAPELAAATKPRVLVSPEDRG
jgi:hypothetical protein